jgi:tetratricopeptide (TPR) repeat protein
MPTRLVDELKRRRVPQVAGFYLAGGWLAFEVADATFPRLGLPDWTVTLVLVLLLLAFPLVVGLAWLYDVTPEGVRRTEAPAPGPDATGSRAGAGPDSATRARVADAAAADRVAAPSPAFVRIAVTGAILVLALAGGAFILFGGGEPDLELAPDALVVLPFTVRGGEDVDVLAEGMVGLLSAKLDGAGELRTADPNAVLSLTRGETDADGARALARRLAAGHYVLGSVLEFGGDLRLEASIYATDGDPEPVAEASVEGPDSSFLALVDELAAALLVAGDLAPPGRMPRIAAMTTENLDALRHFLEGERAIRETRYAEAITRFERAVEADSAFALAYYRMAVAASWAERPELLEGAIKSALRHQDRLAVRDRSLLVAYAAQWDGRNVEAERRYRDIVASYPSDLEAWYELGEVILHEGSFLGIPAPEAREPFERTLALDPGHGAALFHFTNIAAWAQDTILLDSATRAMGRALGGETPMAIRAQWAFARGNPADRARILEELVGSGRDGLPAVFFAGMAARSADQVRALQAAAEDMSVSWDAMAGYAERLANFLVAFGQRDAALDWLEAMEARSTEPPLRTAMLATFPYLRTPPVRLTSLRDRIQAWDPGPVRTDSIRPGEWGDLQPAWPQLRVYLLGLLDSRLGREADAIRRADQLESMNGAPAVRTLAADLARHIRAQVHLDQGRPAEALRIIEGASYWTTNPWDSRFSIVYQHQAEKRLRAEALQALGRHRDAMRWFSVLYIARNGYSYYRSAQSHEALGEDDLAAEHYARFVQRWADADPDFQDLVDDARARLAALAAEG